MIPIKIILHHSATKDSGTVSWGAIRKYHVEVKEWTDIGYHWGLERINGHFEILMGRMPDEQGAHCLGYNIDSLGVCVVGNFDVDPLTKDRQEVLVKLLYWLMLAYRIPFSELYGDRDFRPFKSCPGENLYQFLMDLKRGK